MMTMILNWLSGGIADKVLDAYKARLAAGADTDKLAIDLAKREIEVRSQERIALLGNPFAPANLFAYVLVIYWAKLVLWDTVLGLGTTEPLRGAAGEWAGLIITFVIGKAGAENVARILRR